VAQRPPRKPRSSADAKTKAKKKTAPKKPAPKKPGSKKKRSASTRKKKTGFFSTLTSRLFFFGFGLLAGAVLALALLWGLGVFHLPALDRRPARTAAVQAPPAPPKPRPAERAAKQPLAYEEYDRLDQKIKKIDQALFRVLASLGVGEKDVRFTRITHRQSAGHEWQQAAIEVRLPDGFETDRFSRALDGALKDLALDPPPMMTYVRQRDRVKIDIRFNGVKSHSLTLLTGPAQETPAAKVEPGPQGRVAVIIDDLGLSLPAARCFLAVEAPLTFAVLPFQPHTRDVAEEAHRAGRAVLLHLPMEPSQYPAVDPGPGALLKTMDRAEIQRRVEEAIGEVPFIIGVNNHMGSRFTEDAERMGWVLAEIKQRGLLFLDSRTSVQSMAFQTARQMGVRTAQRTVFLDNVQEPEAIRIQIRRLVTLARQRGRAVAIGHPYPVTCQVLKEEYNYLKSKVELVPITSILD